MMTIQIKIGESYFIKSSTMQGTMYSLHGHTNSPSYIKKWVAGQSSTVIQT